ncbi:hypothetical protein DFH28DRAFT_1123183 [Melampsora americana]|nr:hypothetical protein DFH28DRAFT_1123183 [Melampsora americana]
MSFQQDLPLETFNTTDVSSKADAHGITGSQLTPGTIQIDLSTVSQVLTGAIQPTQSVNKIKKTKKARSESDDEESSEDEEDESGVTKKKNPHWENNNNSIGESHSQ